MDKMISLVTGGAGFIGSHLVDRLVARGDEVVVIDNLSTGDRANLSRHLSDGAITFVQADLLEDAWKPSCKGVDRIYHIAADPDVRASAVSPAAQVRSTVLTTAGVLEAMREFRVPEIVFTSTSTVYGEASVIPTPESYTPMEPVSVYGASKLACEALISSYCHSFGMKGWVYRFANIVGPRSNHGVIWDFVHKLRADPSSLEILGDGKQTKSYLGVGECVDAMLFAAAHSHDTFNVFNIGSEDWIDVVSIADIVCREMGLSGVKYRFTGGDRGWVGDVPRMLLSVDRLKALGWRPEAGSRECMVMAARAMVPAGAP